MINLFQNRSLRFRLVIALSSVSLIIWLITMITEWIKVRIEVDKLFDTQQILFAERIASSDIMQGFHEILELDSLPRHNKQLDDDALAFAVFADDGYPLLNDNRNGRFIPFAPAKGFQNVHLPQQDDSEHWRIYWLKHRDLYIAVGQELEYRGDLIHDIVFTQMWSWLVGLPLLILAILWIVNREIAPLRQLQQTVQQRKPDETDILPTDNLPREILPLVKSLNHYFTRTQTMFNRERRFTSDAAHELRSPLAGLRIQTELAQLTLDDPDAHQRALHNMTSGIDKIAQLIEQLLTLSRLESLVSLDEQEPIDWQQLIDNNVAQFTATAAPKGSKIYTEFAPNVASRQGKALLLSLVLRNLLDNAVRYTPPNSKIYVRLLPDRLIVEDNGNGVSPSELEKLGQPFYRPADRPIESDQDEKGSGLGLSIIKRILELHHFHFTLTQSPLGGLKAEIRF